MTTGIRFDASAPYEVEESDVVYARPDGMELLARVYRPKGTPAAIKSYLHDAAKAAIDDPKFAATMAGRGVDVDYRPGEALRADLWREYKLHTEILTRIGLIKK